jgi:hypothetical protein
MNAHKMQGCILLAAVACWHQRGMLSARSVLAQAVSRTRTVLSPARRAPRLLGEVMAVQFLTYGACVLSGFLAGLLAFKSKDRWCPACGSTTVRIRHDRQSREARPR